MQNPNNPEDTTNYPDDQNTPPGGQNPSTYQLVGYDPNGRPIYADNQGNYHYFSSPDGTWHPYSGEITQTQNQDGPNTVPPQPTPPPTAPPPGGGGAAPPTGSGDFPVFNQPWEPPAQTPLPGAPVFTPPEYKPPPAFSFADFSAPTFESAQNDPGYKFRVTQGQDRLEKNQAYRGLSNTGMSLKEIIDYGQNAASQEYQNVYNRDANTYSMNRGNAVDSYNTNYKSQFYDPYQFAYKGAYDAFGGAMDAWKTGAGFTERANQFNTNTSFNKWWDDYQIYRNDQLDKWNRIYGAATA